MNDYKKHIIDISEYQIDFSKIYSEIIYDPYSQLENFLEDSYLKWKYLPNDLVKRIYSFSKNSNELGVLHIKSIPLFEEIPETPCNSLDYPQQKMKFHSELWLSMVAENIGRIVAYSQEKNGNIFQNLVPVKKNEKLLSSESSDFLLDYHTEIVFHPYMPDFLLLLCLRADHEELAQTFCTSTKMIIDSLSSNQQELLWQPLFKTGVDYSFGSVNGEQGNGRIVPILYGNKDDPFIFYDSELMVGLTNEANDILEYLKELTAKIKVPITLKKGDLLIIDNRRAIHGRSPFTARYDGYDRWVMRSCVTSCLADSAKYRKIGSRVINVPSEELFFD